MPTTEPTVHYQLAEQFLLELKEALQGANNYDEYHCQVLDEDMHGQHVPTAYVLAPYFISKQNSVYLAFYPEHMLLRLGHYDRVTYDAYQNRTDVLKLEYENPNSIQWAITSIRRHFCQEWGSELRPWEK